MEEKIENVTPDGSLTQQQVAVKRGVQTWWVGLIAVVLVYAIAPLIAAVNGASGWAGLAEGWQVWTWEIFKGAVVAGLTALGAWVQRRFLDQSGFTPEPTLESDN